MALLEVLRVRHMRREPWGLKVYVSEDTQVVGFETRAITPFRTISSNTFFNLIPIFNRDLSPACCTGGKVGFCPDGIGPRHVNYGVKRVRKGFLKHNVPDLDDCMRGSHQGWLHSGQPKMAWEHQGWGIARVGVPNGLGRGELGTWGGFMVLNG